MRLGIAALACALVFGAAAANAGDYRRDGWRDGWRDNGRHHHSYRDHRDRDYRRPVYVAPQAYYPAPVYQAPTFSFTPGAGLSIYLPFR